MPRGGGEGRADYAALAWLRWKRWKKAQIAVVALISIVVCPTNGEISALSALPGQVCPPPRMM